MAASDEVIIERHICIKTSGKPWVVGNIDLVGGTEFIRLAQADGNFCRFITGKVVVKKGIFNWSGLAALRKLRQAASVAALTTADAVFDNEHTRKRQKTEAVKKKDELPPFVVIELPSIDDLAALSVKVIPSLDLSAVFSVELKPEVLAHVRALVVAGNNVPPQPAVHQRDSLPSSVIRWHSTKSTFIATRTRHGVKQTKNFRPAEVSSPSKRHAREVALQWIDGLDDNDGSVAEGENGA